MTKHEQYENKTEELALPILNNLGFELYDVEYISEGKTRNNANILRVYIDKEDGVTIEDCETVSRSLNDLLDKYDFIPDSYTFEVSSPGLGRQLKKDRHFEKSMGEEVEIRLFKPMDKRKEFIGILKGVNADKIIIEENEHDVEINRKDVALARLTIQF